MSEQKIFIYHHPNPEIKSFLMGEELVPPLVGHFKKPMDKDSETTLKKLGFIGAQAVRDIMDVAGVHEIRIKPKEIIIRKDLSSSWKDIEGGVLKILKRALRRKQIKIA